YYFFFQAEDGIRDLIVTGVQTCALPIYPLDRDRLPPRPALRGRGPRLPDRAQGGAPLRRGLGRQHGGGLSALRRQRLRAAARERSEERRVGKECRAGWWVGWYRNEMEGM